MSWRSKLWCDAWLLLCFLHVAVTVDCFTCNVDFRQQRFEQNNSCLFPLRDNEKTRCSDVSRFCQGVITRINGVFVQLTRTCEAECHETCIEKGFGIATSECRYCCKQTPDCGKEGYRAASPNTRPWCTLVLLCTALAVRGLVFGNLLLF